MRVGPLCRQVDEQPTRMTTHVALLGHPVAHSLSPRMHNAAFAVRGLDWDYTAHDVEDPVAAVAGAGALELPRANVTYAGQRAGVAACGAGAGASPESLLARHGRGRRPDTTPE